MVRSRKTHSTPKTASESVAPPQRSKPKSPPDCMNKEMRKRMATNTTAGTDTASYSSLENSAEAQGAKCDGITLCQTTPSPSTVLGDYFSGRRAWRQLR